MGASRTLATLALLAFPQLASPQQTRPDATPLVKQRVEAMTGMLSNSHKLERMIYSVEPYKPADAKRAVANLVRLSSEAFELFPPGSVSAGSKARPELWQRPDEFRKLAAASRQSIANLAAAAAKDSLDDLKIAYAKVPPTCVACHQALRVGG